MKKLVTILLALFLILSSNQLGASSNFLNLDDNACVTKIGADQGKKELKLTAHTRGNAPFTFQWSNGETTESIIVEKPGEYCVKVKDADRCLSEACFEVKEKEAECKSVIQSRVSTSGTKLTVVARGKGPFKYKWSTGETTQSILAKKAGKYCVKVVDSDGCESDACIEVKVRDDKDCKTQIRLRRSSKGGVLVARTKGEAPFKYIWSTGENTQIIVVTKSGKYCVKVIDANGCVSEDCIEVKIRDTGDEKCKTIISEVRTPTKVKGHTLVARTKGKAPFKYSWSTGETTQTIVVTKPGTYCVKVEDADGCLSKACFVIKDIKPGDDNCKTVIVSSKLDIVNGTKLTAQTRGKAPFKYKWSNGETTQSIRVNKPGKYCVKVIDANGCVSGDCFEIKEQNDKKCATTIKAERTRDSSIVILTAVARGKAPFTFSWSNGETSQSIKAKVPGKYCVKVKDADGCVSDACFELKVQSDKKCATSIKAERTRDSSIVILTAVARGTAPFKYSWSNGETSETIRAKVPGKYCVKVIDTNRCVSEACIKLEKRGGLNIDKNEVDAISIREDLDETSTLKVKAYPNPMIDQINLDILSQNDQNVNYSMYNMNGQLIKADRLNITEGLNTINIIVNEIKSGQYLLNIVSETGVQNIKITKN